MNEAQAIQVFDELIRRFEPSRQVQKSFDAAFNVIFADLLTIHEDAIEPALKRLKTSTNYLPSAEKVLQAFKAEGKEVAKNATSRREEAWNRQKGGADRRELDKAGSFFSTQEKADEHAMAGMMCLKAQMTDKSHTDKLEFFKLMENRYPGIGWGLAGIDQQKWYEKQKARPHWRPIDEASPQFQLKHGLEPGGL